MSPASNLKSHPGLTFVRPSLTTATTVTPVLRLNSNSQMVLPTAGESSSSSRVSVEAVPRASAISLIEMRGTDGERGSYLDSV
jgi:hypothetical protein